MRKNYILLCMVLTLLILSSCGGLQNLRSIGAMDPITGNKVSIKMSVKRAPYTYPTMHFAVTQDLNGLTKRIAKKGSTVTTQIYQDEYILVETEHEFFLLEEISKVSEDKEKERRYQFFAPVGRFKVDKQKTEFIDFHMPFHLLKDVSAPHYLQDDTAFKKNYSCVASGTIDEFVSFYSKYEIYEVEKQQDAIIIKSESNAMELKFTQADDEINVEFVLS